MHAHLLRITWIIALATNVLRGFSQDPEFTLFNQNRAYLSPASVGEDCQSVNLHYRNQWSNLDGDYSTVFASYEIQPAGLRFNGKEFQNFKVGLGGYVMHDRAGQSVLNTTKIGLQVGAFGALSPRVRIGVGLEFGVLDKTLDWSRLTFPDMIDPNQGFIYGTSISPNQQGNTKFTDVSSGIRMQYALRSPRSDYSTPWVEWGLAGHHLNEPNESLFEGPSVLPIKVTGYIHGMLFLGKNRPTNIHYGTFYRRQGDFQHLLTGFSFGYTQNNQRFEIGPWYRGMPGYAYKDALILAFKVQGPGLGFSYSMDLTSSQLSPSGWAHELGLVMLLNCNGKDRNNAECWECDDRYKTHLAKGKKQRNNFGNNAKQLKKGTVKRKGIFNTEPSFKPPNRFTLWWRRFIGKSNAVYSRPRARP